MNIRYFINLEKQFVKKKNIMREESSFSQHQPVKKARLRLSVE